MKRRNFGVTIFTPTYNRQSTLERLYKSLLIQTNKQFEWLIVDDGSTDNTRQLINSWINDDLISIRYIYQENQGKPAAHNTGVLNSNYNLFMCVDSDDYLVENAVEKINEINSRIYQDDSVIGIISYKCNVKDEKKRTKTINTEFITVSKLYLKYHYKGELALAYKTDILIENLFPRIDGEKFIPEAYLYDRLDNIGVLYLLQNNTYLYEYMNDGYTKNSADLLKNNVEGYILFSKQRLEISNIMENRIKGAIQYNIANLIKNENLKYMKNKYVLLLLLTFIPSYMYYLKKYKL